MRIALWAAGICFALDQVSKWYVVHYLALKDVIRMEVFPPFLVFHMAWNEGVNFGLFSGYADYLRWIWVVLSIGVTIWLIRWMTKEAFNKWAQLSAGLLIGGALGNAVDRVIYGAVADFLNMSCCGFDNPYAFNVADITIFAGAFGLVFFSPEKQT